MIEEADSPQGPRTSNSALLFGTGNIVTEVVYSDKPRVFFRVSAASLAPGPPLWDRESPAWE
ncbi:MAG: hypothetical protein EOP86_10230 [Verrucomicrobiaceae bacterium]|nr:MAG: hypothetical protein EOP86_10230 [Verrucomicrobiaceae bacterium]